MRASSLRNRVQRIKKNILKYKENQAKIKQKLSKLYKKIQRNERKLSSSNNPNNILKQLQRLRKKEAKHNKEIADLDNKIAKEQKKLNREEKRLNKQKEKDLDSKFEDIDTTLEIHEEILLETQESIEKIKLLPEKIVVLFLASNPSNTERLKLDEEFREINEMIRKSEYRDSIKLVSNWATRIQDIFQAINECQPSIIHFSGHGSSNSKIYFHNHNGKAVPVSTQSIVETMRTASSDIRLVFFNTCHSEFQAKSVTNFVQASIGMNKSIGDKAACIFASQFYSSIGFGLSLHESFEQAKTRLLQENIPESQTPVLHTHGDLDPKKLIIVKPPDLSD